MDNIEKLEQEYKFKIDDIENKELYELLANSINFLSSNNNEAGQDYLSIAVAEGIIPETRTHIKKFVLQSYKLLLKQNNSVRKINNPVSKLIYSNLDYELAQPLFEYFEDEKKCLDTLKELLNAKIDIPSASFTGIFTSTLIHIHNVNIDKFNKIIDISQNLQKRSFSITLPDSYITPVHQELVNNIETTVSKILKKNKQTL